MNPTVSAIIPTYNYGRFLREAADSTLAQTRPVLEVIVVDDGSTDNTREVMAAYAANTRVRYQYKTNGGPASARNLGIRLAQGEFIAFLDADDLWVPDKIERQLEFFSRVPEAVLIGTDRFDLSAPPPVTDRAAVPAWEDYTIRDLLEFAPFSPSSVMLRKTVFDRVGLFDEQMRYVEDFDMWSRIAAQFRVYKLLLPLTGARNHPEAQGLHVGPSFEYYQRVQDKLFAALPVLQAHPRWRRLADAREYTHQSWRSYCQGNRRGAIRATLISIGKWPLALRASKREKRRWARVKLLLRYLLFAPPKC